MPLKATSLKDVVKSTNGRHASHCKVPYKSIKVNIIMSELYIHHRALAKLTCNKKCK